MNNTKTDAGFEARRRKKLVLVSCFSTAVIVMILLALMDLIGDIRTDASAYEIRYETDDTFSQAGKVYRLYIDNELRGNIDQNEYCLMDENGNTDYKYCRIMDDASRFTYFLILSVMIYIVLIIAKEALESTPFTINNIRLVKVIAVLQLLLSILPGAVKSAMSFLKFSYSSTVLDEKWLFMVIIAFVIGAIAHIFERGLVIQEDVDSIA
ncbi:MAG: hypothetical protein K6E85_11740 [Lachnospiraceae bacterium]|nr:hypothetical protein [Lachnospiraceae bacterium]